MLGFLFVLCIIALYLLFTYAPVMHQDYILKRIDKKLAHEIELLKPLLINCLIVVTYALGNGESQNSDITFAQAQERQAVVANAISILMCEMVEE